MTNAAPPTWFTPDAAAAYINRKRITVVRALRAGQLWGYQNSPNGPWSIHRDDLDHYLMGGSAETAPTRKVRPIRKAV